MTTAVANPYDPSLKRFLWYSVAFHAGIALVAALASYFQLRGNEWAGVGGQLGGVNVTLVSSAGIPMPRPNLPTESHTVDPTQGLYKVEPPKIEQPPPDATTLPTFAREKPLPPSRKSKTLEPKTRPPDNAVPYGKGGSPEIPTGYSQNPGSSSGVTIQGQGGGDFASRYGWYIEAARRRVGPNWNVLMLDPAVRNSTTLHCVISFTILRDGGITDVRITKSSGNSSWDYSGLRAIQNSAPFAPLPSDWTGGNVAVLWDFPEREN